MFPRLCEKSNKSKVSFLVCVCVGGGLLGCVYQYARTRVDVYVCVKVYVQVSGVCVCVCVCVCARARARECMYV